MAPTGEFTFNEDNTQITELPGIQGWCLSQPHPYISDVPDVFSAVATAMLRTVAATALGVGVAEQRFTILKASLHVTCTNSSNVDVDIWCYPWLARYDGLDINQIYSAPSVLETGTGEPGTVDGDEKHIGWTPFQARYITESVKLLKPRKVHLQGGQSYTFKMQDSKPLYVTYGRMNSLEGSGYGAVAKRTRGMFFSVRGGAMVNPVSSAEATWSGFNVNVVTTRSYRWVATAMPYNFTDNVVNTTVAGAYNIIQPQTGALLPYVDTT